MQGVDQLMFSFTCLMVFCNLLVYKTHCPSRLVGHNSLTGQGGHAKWVTDRSNIRQKSRGGGGGGVTDLTNAVWAALCANKCPPKNLEYCPEYLEVPPKSQNSQNFNFISLCFPENFSKSPDSWQNRQVPGRILFFLPKQTFLEMTTPVKITSWYILCLNCHFLNFLDRFGLNCQLTEMYFWTMVAIWNHNFFLPYIFWYLGFE